MTTETTTRFDLIVVGAGIVGLGAAYAAHEAGLTVLVIDKAHTITGSSVRNFGHIGVTGQSGVAYGHAIETRKRWLRLADLAGFDVAQRGATLVARTSSELDVLQGFAAQDPARRVTILGAAGIHSATPVRDPNLVGGAHFPLDLQVDPRTAAPAIAAWLAASGVSFRWGTTVLGVSGGLVHTASGDWHSEAVVVAVNFEVDQFFPQLAATSGLQRCGLDMMTVAWSHQTALTAPLLTGSSLLRYSAFATIPGIDELREQHRREHPRQAELDINQMYTQRPDGSLIVGDTHYRGLSISPFQDEAAFDTMLELTRELFGTRELQVLQRWQGIYATAPGEFLVESPHPGVTVVSVTTGIGMTTGLGLAASVVSQLFDTTHRKTLE